MICNNIHLTDILRVSEIKDLIWVMRYQSHLLYLPSLKVDNYMGHVATKPIFGFFDKARLNTVPKLQRLARSKGAD